MENKKHKNLWLIGGAIVSGIVIGLIVFLVWKYISFYQDVKQLQDSVLRYSFENGPLKPPLAANEYVSVWGAFGDFIGGTLNPFLTFLTVIGLLYTIYLNREANKINNDELKNSVEQLRLSAESLRLSSLAQNEIEKTQKLQQFDSNIFSLFSHIKASRNDFSTMHHQGAVAEFYRSIFYGEFDIDNIVINSNSKLSEFFKITKIALKRIKNNSFMSSNDKEFYSSIIDSYLSGIFLHLLVVFAICDDDFADTLIDLGMFRDINLALWSVDSRMVFSDEINFPLIIMLNLIRSRKKLSKNYFKQFEQSEYLKKFYNYHLNDDVCLLFFEDNLSVEFYYQDQYSDKVAKANLIYNDGLQFKFENYPLSNSKNDCFVKNKAKVIAKINGLELHFSDSDNSKFFVPDGDFSKMTRIGSPESFRVLN